MDHGGGTACPQYIITVLYFHAPLLLFFLPAILLNKITGVWVQGTVAEINFHTVTAKDRVERYIACYMDVKWAYVVEMDKYGAEVTLEEEEVAASPRKRVR